MIIVLKEKMIMITYKQLSICTFISRFNLKKKLIEIIKNELSI